MRARPVVRRRGAGRTDRAAGHRLQHPLPESSASGSRRDGRPCSTRRRHPCRRAAECTRRSRGTRRQLASLHRAGLLARWVVEIRFDRRRRAAQAIGDLPDGEPLELAVVPRQRDGSATLDNPIGPSLSHRLTLRRSVGVSVAVGTQGAEAPAGPSDPRKACRDPRRTEHLRPDSQACQDRPRRAGYSGPAFMNSRVLAPSGSTTSGPV